MEEWHFADILLIVLICGLIYVLVSLAQKSFGKKRKNPDETVTCETDQENGQAPEDN